MKTIVLVLAVLLAQSIDAAAQANPSQPLTAEGVWARHMAAIGGEAALRAIRDRYMVMTMSMSMSKSPGAETRSESFVRSPNKVYSRTTMPGIGLMESGYDGTTAWSMSEATGPVIIPEPQAAQLRNGANLNQSFQEGGAMTLRAPKQLEGRTVHVIDVVTPDSTKMTEYFDAESGLLVGMDVPSAAVIEGRAAISFRDYRRFGNVMVATVITHRLKTGDSLVTRIEHLDHRPIPDSVFALPKAVQVLTRRSPR